jgi:(1->4)-alpha-D-glucan 1-alpha-D-glucosylmutase
MRDEQARFAMRFQQLTGPIMAKGVEDTAFYRYNRLVSLNEVGGEPSRFGTSVSTYHAANEERLRAWPLSMTATSTHDTTRGEEVRARLAVLTEMPEVWESRVHEWRAIAEKYRIFVEDEAAPSAGDEYLFYQSVFGAMPFAPSEPRARVDASFVDRLREYMAKATKEAKLRTSWINPHPEYDAAVARFCVAMLGDDAFTSSAWSFHLVDPDNRRPVDYAARRAMLADVRRRAGEPLALVRDLLRSFEDGAPKLYVTHALLALRRREPDLFLAGDYRAITAGDHVVAFARTWGGHRAVTIVPRLSHRLTRGLHPWPIGAAWGDARIVLPVRSAWHNVLTGETHEGDDLAMRDVLREFPVAVLLGDDAARRRGRDSEGARRVRGA